MKSLASHSVIRSTGAGPAVAFASFHDTHFRQIRSIGTGPGHAPCTDGLTECLPERSRRLVSHRCQDFQYRDNPGAPEREPGDSSSEAEPLTRGRLQA